MSYEHKDKRFVFYIDEALEDLFHKLEDISDSGRAHICVINAETKEQAISTLSSRLHDFWEQNMQPCDEEE